MMDRAARCIYCQVIDLYEESAADCRHCGETNKLTPLVNVPNMKIPASVSHNGKTKVMYGSRAGHVEDGPPIPINICEEKPDGSYRVTRIGAGEDDE